MKNLIHYNTLCSYFKNYNTSKFFIYNFLKEILKFFNISYTSLYYYPPLTYSSLEKLSGEIHFFSYQSDVIVIYDNDNDNIKYNMDFIVHISSFEELENFIQRYRKLEIFL